MAMTWQLFWPNPMILGFLSYLSIIPLRLGHPPRPPSLLNLRHPNLNPSWWLLDHLDNFGSLKKNNNKKVFECVDPTRKPHHHSLVHILDHCKCPRLKLFGCMLLDLSSLSLLFMLWKFGGANSINLATLLILEILLVLYVLDLWFLGVFDLILKVWVHFFLIFDMVWEETCVRHACIESNDLMVV